VTISLDYRIVDVFTDTPLEGNGLAVFTDGAALSDETMQRLARELHLSETVFALSPQAGGDARIRIFTPGRELPFAGHPTLGSAFVLGGELELIGLETGAGIVPVALERSGGRIVFGRMTQPHPTIAPFDDAAALLSALAVSGSELPIEVYVNGPRTIYVALEDELAVTALAPNMQALTALGANICCFVPPAAAGRCACSRRRSASPRTPRPARLRARSRCTWRATGRSPTDRRSRSTRARRSCARRCCTRASRARASSSSGSRSAAAP
jgi:PhzF family phenazine biosynthesis protein